MLLDEFFALRKANREEREPAKYEIKNTKVRDKE